MTGLGGAVTGLGDRDAAARKAAPIARGVLWYFPDAIDYVADTIPSLDPAGMLIAGVLYHQAPERSVNATLIARAALDLLLAEVGGTGPTDRLSLAAFVRWYAPALAEVAGVSLLGAVQHCGGVLGWAREKSTDHADCIIRHWADAGTLDTDGGRHTAKIAWRALALLQTEIEAVA